MAVLKRSAGFQVKKVLCCLQAFLMTVFSELIAGSVCCLGSKPEKWDFIKTSRRLRETREGWPLQTVEANGDSRSTNERGPSLVGLFGLSCRHKRFLAAPVRPVKNIFFSSPYTLFQFICPHCPASYLGRQSCWVACLLVCVSGFCSE